MSDVPASSHQILDSAGTTTIGPIGIRDYLNGSFTCPAAVTSANVTFKVSNRDGIQSNNKTLNAAFSVPFENNAVLTSWQVDVAAGRSIIIPEKAFRFEWLLLEFNGVEPAGNKFDFMFKSK